MRGRSGFTLVEVLVAVGLLVLIAALSLPVALTNTAGARAQSTERMLRLTPAMARAEAQRLGAPVGVVLLPSPDGAELRVAIVREPDAKGDNPRDLAADPSDVATWPTVAQPQTLPRGTRLWEGELDALDDVEPVDAAGVSTLDAAFAVPDELLDEAVGESRAGQSPRAVVLAWFLSDGSAFAGRPAAIRLADDRVLRIRVEALAGKLAFDVLERATERDDARGLDEDAQVAPLEEGMGEQPAGTDDSSPAADSTDFEPLAFDEMAFDELVFDEIELEDPSQGFSDLGDPASENETSSGRDAATQPRETLPQTPQPR